MVTNSSERGSALVFALATLTLVAITIAGVASEIQSRGAGVIIEERTVRLTALSDAAMAETLAELSDHGTAFAGADETIVLQWASVSVLRSDEWYALTIFQPSGGVVSDTTYTRATAWRVPLDRLVRRANLRHVLGVQMAVMTRYPPERDVP